MKSTARINIMIKLDKLKIASLLVLTMAYTAQAETGWATYYTRASCKHEGTGGAEILMANGKPLDDSKPTCALWRVGTHGRPLRPDGRMVVITDTTTGKFITCPWTDNGPGKGARKRGVIVDLSKKAMVELAGTSGLYQGRIKVKVVLP